MYLGQLDARTIALRSPLHSPSSTARVYFFMHLLDEPLCRAIVTSTTLTLTHANTVLQLRFASFETLRLVALSVALKPACPPGSTSLFPSLRSRLLTDAQRAPALPRWPRSDPSFTPRAFVHLLENLALWLSQWWHTPG